MVNFFKDDPDTNAEAKVDLDLEMQDLRDFSMHSPATIAKTRLNSLAASSTGSDTVKNGSTSVQFPPPYVFGFCRRQTTSAFACRQR